MARQHATPIYVPPSGAWVALGRAPHSSAGGVREDFIQALVHEHPSILPIVEIDPIFKGGVAMASALRPGVP